MNADVAKGTGGSTCQNPPVDENALKDPPEGLSCIKMDLNALNNPPIDPNSWKRHPPEGSTAVFSASIVAATNTEVSSIIRATKESADDDGSGY